ncbi:hypothetical protein [Haloarchaeobius sp. DFWS5]|uniref:hypothetical protein n=1 Tax=Haloarchaeobius sp. DFWS5 TaxID=3446114 RepID=UPI003EBD119C
MQSTRRCPDCDVRLDEMDMRTGDGFALYLMTDEPRPGILGGLGAKEKVRATVMVCPKCGLIRHYADLDGDA